MEGQLTNYQCPSCAGGLEFSAETGKLECPYCGSGFEVWEVEALYRSIGKTFEALSPWQIYVLTSAENFESLYGRRADKVRKLYNGMIPCRLYQYFKPQNMKAGAAQLANSGKKCVGKQKNRNF